VFKCPEIRPKIPEIQPEIPEIPAIAGTPAMPEIAVTA